MPEATTTEVTRVILEAIQTEALPDSDSVAAASVKSECLHDIIRGIERARDEVQTEIKSLSRDAASDVDGWIEQAQQLQIDIETSRNAAREIVEQAEAAASLREKYNDAAQKVDLLQLEIVFTGKLQKALGDLQKTAKRLSEVQDAISPGRCVFTWEELHHIEESLSGIQSYTSTNAISLLRQRVSKVKQSLVEEVESLWNGIFLFDKPKSEFALSISDNANDILVDLIEVSTKLDSIDTKIARLANSLSSVIFTPMLAYSASLHIGKVFTDKKTLQITTQTPAPDAESVSNEVLKVIHFLNNNLPTQLSSLLSQSIMPPVISRLLSYWLPQYIPANVEEAASFAKLLKVVNEFADKLTSISWSGADDLIEWVDQGPKLWLSKRREVSLTGVRKSLSESINRTKIIERVETQLVSREVMAGTSHTENADANEDWDAAWQEDEDRVNGNGNGQADVEDASAWGFDDETESPERAPHRNGLSKSDSSATNPDEGEEEEEDDDDENEAWGWNDGDNAQVAESPPVTQAEKLSANCEHPSASQEQRELTLKELYTITAIPDELCAMITQVIQDAQTLRLEEYEDTLIGPVAPALFSLPTLILAGFRALASSYYMPLLGGNMYLYNDCVRLATDLAATAKEQIGKDALSGLSKSAWPSTRMKLDADIAALESFGRRAYGREMESQRTILRDLLDGTQGFANCSEAPYSTECRNAIVATVDRVKEVEKQWCGILSRSALLQSLGSLVSTVVGKIIVDIEDLTDISEPDSRQLRNLCETVSKLNELFIQENPADPGQISDMTGVYVPSWFKFQYLSEIMDSSLADIRHFWTEGGLKLEFDANEVVDLLQALFAESDHRRKAIAEIRGM